MSKPLIILTGPTAVGKTELSIKLAQALNGEIISADSMQVYRHMDIGTAKITDSQMQGIPHHLIDILEPAEAFHVCLFQQSAKAALNGIYERNRVPIVVGGTGFYIQALLYDIQFDPDEDKTEIRRELEKIKETRGPDALYRELERVDPRSAAVIHKNNVKRVMRALEYFRQTGRSISEHNDTERNRISPYDSCYFVLNDERSLLYESIDKRVDSMMEKGLEQEVEHLIRSGCKQDMVSMQGLGYKEMFSYLEGGCTLQEAEDAIKQNTRHFAKRQLTWFRREKDVIWLDKQELGRDDTRILKHMLSAIKQKTGLQPIDGGYAS